MTFDWAQIGTMIGTFVLGIGGVAAFLTKALPIVKKVLKLSMDTVTFLTTISNSIEDDNLSASEWTTLSSQAKALRSDWASFTEK